MAKHVHFLGIGGSGTSAAAAIAQAQGFQVTGCDLEPHNVFTTQFKKTQLLKGHNPKHIVSRLQTGFVGSKVDILAVTPAIYSLDPDNKELQEAKKQGIEVLTWQQFVGKYLMKDKFVIAVAGTHGKTTTTGMIAKILEDTNLDPTVALGAIVLKWGTNYRIPRQSIHGRTYFVIEADEYHDNFLGFRPDISVVTNIEMDHPEYFKDFKSYQESFKNFLLQTKGTIVANFSDPVVKKILGLHLFESEPERLFPQSRRPKGANVIIDYSKHLIDFPLKIPGYFNIQNASAAYQVGLLLGIKTQTIRKSLSSYTGVGRRFEYIGNYKGAKVYSDFGHHPTEIRETMQAAREKFPSSRILLIYQPHMFTRTKALFYDFVKVFRELLVDKIIITDIYPSREVDTGIVSSKKLVNATRDNRLVYHTKREIKDVLDSVLQPRDILFFMGAGDIDKIANQLVQENS